MKVFGMLKRRAARIKTTTLLRISAVFTLLGLAMMVWSMVQPTPLPVMLAMSVGQMLGTGAFVLYLVVIVIDLRTGRRMRRESRQNLQFESQRLLREREETK